MKAIGAMKAIIGIAEPDRAARPRGSTSYGRCDLFDPKWKPSRKAQGGAPVRKSALKGMGVPSGLAAGCYAEARAAAHAFGDGPRRARCFRNAEIAATGFIFPRAGTFFPAAPLAFGLERERELKRAQDRQANVRVRYFIYCRRGRAYQLGHVAPFSRPHGHAAVVAVAGAAGRSRDDDAAS